MLNNFKRPTNIGFKIKAFFFKYKFCLINDFDFFHKTFLFAQFQNFSNDDNDNPCWFSSLRSRFRTISVTRNNSEPRIYSPGKNTYKAALRIQI